MMNHDSALATTAESSPDRRWRIPTRYLPPLLITSILIGAQLTFGILGTLERTGVAILVAIGAELVLARLSFGRWPHPASAYISGISVGILVRSPFLWPFALTSLLSILSKYALRWGGRHLWNPSNFGICAVLLLAPQSVSVLSIQWGNELWAMVVIWILGFAIVWRVRRLHMSATYVAAFVVFTFLRSAVTGSPFLASLAPITGPMYQLFIFFMVTDPQTTVRSRRGQIVVVIAVAFVEMLLRFAEVIYAPFYALFLVGPTALLIERWHLSRLARSAASTAPESL